MLAILVTIYCSLSVGHALPIVDPGLFVIMGVNSCREGSGYCLLGLDCTLDEDFLPDDRGGHCNGLRSAFTPSANFICCRYNSQNSDSPLLNATSVMLDSIPAILLSMDDVSTEVEQQTTTELPQNIVEELKPKADFAVLTDKGILTHLSSVTEVNLDLLVHDNIEERSVNNESDVTTMEPPDQDGDIKTTDLSNEQADLTTTEIYLSVVNIEQLLAAQTVKTTTDATQANTELDAATIEPIRHNEISVESEETKVQPSTTMPCSTTAGKNCWLVKFMNGTNVMCLGSFLSSNIIVTAANCVSRVFDLGLAAVTLQTLGGAVIPRNLIRDVIVHEEYNMKSTDVLLNDIGMVRLESALKLTPSICTLCLPNSETDLMDKPCDRISKKYKKNKMLELPGSPMVCQGSTLGGVVSSYNPGPVYTPISDYLPWIRHNMDIIPLEWQR